MHVWILQTGEPLHCDVIHYRPMRAMNLANALINRGHTVTIWSSDFFHQEKRHRTGLFTKLTINDCLSICLIPSPGYQKNIGLLRLYDHLILARNLQSILELSLSANGVLKPDLAFIGYPPIETAFVFTNWLHTRGIPTVLDIKDRWPQIFPEAFPKLLRPWARLAFAPYSYTAKHLLKKTTCLSSITSSFLNSYILYGERNTSVHDTVLPLSSPRPSLSARQLREAKDWWASQGIDHTNPLRFLFIGSLSNAFTFEYLIEAFSRLVHHNPSVELIICGDGEHRARLMTSFCSIPNVFFPGWVDIPQASFIMSNSLASIAPYKCSSDFVMSIPNKILDSLMYGLPILTCLQGEVKALIIEEQVGIFCEGTIDSWYDAMLSLVSSPALRSDLSQKCLATYEQQFSFESVYNRFVTKLEVFVNAQ